MSNSYTSQGIGHFLGVALNRVRTNDAGTRVQDLLNDIRTVESRIHEAFGVELKNVDVLEIGPGQFLCQSRYLAVHNRVTGLDTDVIAVGINPLPYLEMFLRNGWERTAKTVGRKLLGVDHAYRQAILKQLGSVPRVCCLRADASQIPVSGFDFVYTRAVFHHLPNPIEAVEECKRVLRPGGILYIALEPYTSPTGCVDPRITSERPWAHLRPEFQSQVCPTAFVNKLRVEEWRMLFSLILPGVRIVLRQSEPRFLHAAAELKDAGHLADYSFEELTAGELIAMWRKP